MSVFISYCGQFLHLGSGGTHFSSLSHILYLRQSQGYGPLSPKDPPQPFFLPQKIYLGSTNFTHLFLPSISAQYSLLGQSHEFMHSFSLFCLGRQMLKIQSKCKICLRYVVFSNLTVGTTLPYKMAIQHILRYFCIFPYCGGTLNIPLDIAHNELNMH